MGLIVAGRNQNKENMQGLSRDANSTLRILHLFRVLMGVSNITIGIMIKPLQSIWRLVVL